MQTILAIDDERSIRETYRIALSEPYRVVLAEDGKAGLKVLDEQHVDLIILDHMMPGMNGLEFLEALKEREEEIPVIVVTAMNSVSVAVDAMKQGARDYLIKPFDVDQLTMLIARTLEEERVRQELCLLRSGESRGFDSIVGNSPALQRTLALAKEAAEVESTVLITGESGTGKDVLARAIHSGGARAEGPFVHVSCCAIPGQLVESELFGHERGAFTGAIDRRHGKIQVADGGTAFLDEIGEMPFEAQSKLLRVLQDGCFYPVGSSKSVEVDVRFICATNRDIKACVKGGTFREDLYYRINVIPIEMPPLRQRREDIPELTEHFVKLYAPQVNAAAAKFSREALNRLAAYHWPGNIRELENTVQRILIMNRDKPVIEPEHLHYILPDEEPPAPQEGEREFEGLPLDEARERLETHLIKRALERSDYVQSRAAELLGTTRRILKYKMDQLNIAAEPPARRGERVSSAGRYQ